MLDDLVLKVTENPLLNVRYAECLAKEGNDEKAIDYLNKTHIEDKGIVNYVKGLIQLYKGEG